MALFKFTKAILEGKPIQVFNYGKHRRDFTYIADIIEGVTRVLDRPARGNPAWSGLCPDPGSSRAPWRVYNIGNSEPVLLTGYIQAIENALGMKATVELLPLQMGDMPETCADINDFVKNFNFKPVTSVSEDVHHFVRWFRGYYQC